MTGAAGEPSDPAVVQAAFGLQQGLHFQDLLWTPMGIPHGKSQKWHLVVIIYPDIYIYIYLYIYIYWLVVYLPLWKMMEFLSWDDDIPNILGKS